MLSSWESSLEPKGFLPKQRHLLHRANQQVKEEVKYPNSLPFQDMEEPQQWLSWGSMETSHGDTLRIILLSLY